MDIFISLIFACNKGPQKYDIPDVNIDENTMRKLLYTILLS